MTKRSKRRATNAEVAQAKHALLTAILLRGAASTDDAHELFELPNDVEPKSWGAVTGGLQAERLIHRVGELHTKRRLAHGRRIGLYQVTDVEAATRERDRLANSAARKRPAQLTLRLDEAGPMTTIDPTHRVAPRILTRRESEPKRNATQHTKAEGMFSLLNGMFSRFKRRWNPATRDYVKRFKLAVKREDLLPHPETKDELLEAVKRWPADAVWIIPMGEELRQMGLSAEEFRLLRVPSCWLDDWEADACIS